MATMLTSFENSFDKYEALSTPLYQTATFKQVIEITNECCPFFFLPKWGTESFELCWYVLISLINMLFVYIFHLQMVSHTRLHYQL